MIKLYVKLILFIEFSIQKVYSFVVALHGDVQPPRHCTVLYTHRDYNLARLLKLSVRIFRVQAAAQVPTEYSKEIISTR